MSNRQAAQAVARDGLQPRQNAGVRCNNIAVGGKAPGYGKWLPGSRPRSCILAVSESPVPGMPAGVQGGVLACVAEPLLAGVGVRDTTPDPSLLPVPLGGYADSIAAAILEADRQRVEVKVGSGMVSLPGMNRNRRAGPLTDNDMTIRRPDPSPPRP